MTPRQLFTASRILIVAGKGGVGKTTVSATLALSAARQGLRVLVVDLEGKSSLGGMLAVDSVTYEPTAVDLAGRFGISSGSVHVRLLTPDAALVDYLSTHGLGRISNRMSKAGIVDIVSTATPGLRDLLVLGKIKQLENSNDFDLTIVDAPAAGHAVTFLRSPKGVQQSVASGALNSQATEVLEMLGDPKRCSVVLVTLPEETPVNELVQTAYTLEDEVGVMLGPIICNGWWTAEPGLETDLAKAAKAVEAEMSAEELESLATASAFRRSRNALQERLIRRLGDELPLPLITLPYLFTTNVTLDDVSALSDELLRQLTT